MNDLEVKRFQISRTGVHTDSNGLEHIFSDKLFDTLVKRFNQLANHGNQQTPLYLEHPQSKSHNDPTRHQNYGYVSSLELDNGRLYAVAWVNRELVNLVKSGQYQAVSAGFMKVGDDLWLDHVAFVKRPAVKGMEVLSFSEHSFVQNCVTALVNTHNFNAGNTIHEKALSWMKAFNTNYETAVISVVREQANTANFSKRNSNNQSYQLHQKALAYQAQYGVSYEVAVRACLKQGATL